MIAFIRQPKITQKKLFNVLIKLIKAKEVNNNI